MRKVVSILLVLSMLFSIFTITAFAAGEQPLGGCPVGFEVHPFMEHSGDQMMTHIGVQSDLNGDGFICMQMVTRTLCLRVDDALPLP